MSAYTIPAADAPAEEWGRLAMSLPGWRWMPGALGRAGSFGQLNVRLRSGDEKRVAPDVWPDPDDPATAGCLLALLGFSMPDWWIATTVRQDGVHIVRASQWGHARVEGEGRTLGRACIAAAEALGRWPGGEG